MDGKSTSSLGRATMLCIAILFGLMAAPTGVLSGFAGGLPDQIAAPFVEQWPLLKTLWASNPAAARQILMQQPLIVIAHSEPGAAVPAWKLFFYPVPVTVQLLVAILAVTILRADLRGATRRRLVALLSGMAVLVFVMTYVQLAACCTGGPRWALDVWLFSRAYNPLDALVDWQALYSGIEGMLPFVQLALALFGMALLATGLRRARNADATANPHPDSSANSPER